MIKLFKIGAAICLSAVLAACGGGGGFSGDPIGPSAQLRVFPPVSALSMPVTAEGSTNIQVQGGRPPYVIVSSSPAVVAAALSSSNVISIRASQPGTAELTVVDQERKQVTIAATVTVTPLASSEGTAISLAPKEVRTVNLRGGLGPFIVSSGDRNIATASVSNSVVTITAQAKTGGVPILVTDSLGATFTIQVTVTDNPVKFSPASVVGSALSTVKVAVLGGVEPFNRDSVRSTNQEVATATLTGRELEVRLLKAGNASISFTDASGTVSTISVTVNANTVRVIPASADVLETQRAAVNFPIYGGQPPYVAIISPADGAIVSTAISASPSPAFANSTGVLSVTVNACVLADRAIPIDVYDAQFQVQRVTVNVLDVPGPPACP